VEELGNDGDPIGALATRITWSEAASVNLLSGQRGSGKSTELRRLRKLLQDEGCVVCLCDMRDYMNLTMPVEITDFFISVMGALNDAVQDTHQENVAHEATGSA
jgi:energy-coupling factor transporter ATP-binding protein EcfA2